MGAVVTSVELAAIFEIGRLMHARGISAWPAPGADPTVDRAIPAADILRAAA